MAPGVCTGGSGSLPHLYSVPSEEQGKGVWGLSPSCSGQRSGLQPGSPMPSPPLAPSFEPRGGVEGVGSCRIPSALGLCHSEASQTSPAAPQGSCLARSQKHHPTPRPPRHSPVFLGGGTGTSTCRLVPRGSWGTVSRCPPAGHRPLGAVGSTWRVLGPSRASECGPRVGSGPAGAQLLALLGQRMQKAGVCCRHRFPFMALLLPSCGRGTGIKSRPGPQLGQAPPRTAGQQAATGRGGPWPGRVLPSHSPSLWGFSHVPGSCQGVRPGTPRPQGCTHPPVAPRMSQLAAACAPRQPAAGRERGRAVSQGDARTPASSSHPHPQRCWPSTKRGMVVAPLHTASTTSAVPG